MDIENIIYTVCGRRINVQENSNESLISMGVSAEEILYIIFELLDRKSDCLRNHILRFEKASIDEIMNNVGAIESEKENSSNS